MKTIAKWTDEILDGVQAILLSFLLKLGPFFVALMPALFTGYAIYSIFAPVAGTNLALSFAVVVSFAIETVGILLSHTAIEQYNGWRRGRVDTFKVWLMVGLVPVYICSVSISVWWAGDAFHSLVQALGIVSPFLTCSVYIAVALARDLASIEQTVQDESQHGKELERDELQYQREIERLRMQMEQEQKLRKMELDARVKMERNSRKKPATPGAQDNAQNTGNQADTPQNAPPIRTPKREWRDLAGEILRANPDISGAELGRRIGASERTGQNILNELTGRESYHQNGKS